MTYTYGGLHNLGSTTSAKDEYEQSLEEYWVTAESYDDQTDDEDDYSTHAKNDHELGVMDYWKNVPSDYRDGEADDEDY